MEITFNTSQLLDRSGNEQLYGLLVDQLQKDVHRANLTWGFTKSMSPNEVKTRLQEGLRQLRSSHYNDYLNLLYIIDVPERELQQVREDLEIPVAEQVTYLVLKRELQKVRLRAQYGQT